MAVGKQGGKDVDGRATVPRAMRPVHGGRTENGVEGGERPAGGGDKGHSMRPRPRAGEPPATGGGRVRRGGQRRRPGPPAGSPPCLRRRRALFRHRNRGAAGPSFGLASERAPAASAPLTRGAEPHHLPALAGCFASAPERSAEGTRLRLLFLGDVVGRSGRDALTSALPGLRQRLRLDLVVVNGENASHGFGLAPDMARAFLEAGADVITLGNHAWDRREIIPFLESEPRVIRPANFPPGTPGRGSHVAQLGDGRRALVVNVMGRLFMDALDDPFRATQAELQRHRMGAGGTVQAVVIDVHAEGSSEKAAFGHSFDGQASLVVGTHTHSPSADHQILPGGTAYMTDAGMCGDYDSVIGMQKAGAALRFWRKMPGERLAPADGEATLCGVFVETDDATGLARRVEPLRQGGRLSQAMPEP